MEIEVAKPKNPQADFKEANNRAGLNKDFDPPIPANNKPPDGYTWHHHEDGKTMILVDEDVHIEFRHIGEQSTANGENKNFWVHDMESDEEMSNMFFIANTFNDFFDNLYEVEG